MRIFARDSDDNTLTLIYLQQSRLGEEAAAAREKRTVVGKLDAYGDEWQIVHPGGA